MNTTLTSVRQPNRVRASAPPAAESDVGLPAIQITPQKVPLDTDMTFATLMTRAYGSGTTERDARHAQCTCDIR